ncbi:MAG TPA: hypothetical protein VGB77_18525 [Abditibacteriaceae bacterium]|jgi:ABC-type transport system involved in multi-copper enzyme maturation permease subunit
MHSVSLPPLRRWLSHLFEVNPVFKRELRARWRRPAAYLTLFFYAVPLALGMILLYSGTVDETLRGDATLANIGKELFDGLILTQIALWLFISAVMAAPAIAGERERGLLEALQLANLPARRIVAGKWLSLFSFQALLFLVPLPVVAICFLLGGVEPRTFVDGAITVAFSALCGTAIGLYFSSIRLRPGAALRDTILFLVMWSALAAMASPGISRSWPLLIKRVLSIVELTHPLGGMMWTSGEQFQWPARDLLPGESPWGFGWPGRGLVGGPLYTPIDSQTAWLLCIGGLALLALLFFILALRGTGRSLLEPEISRRAAWKPGFKGRQKNAPQASKTLPRRAEKALYVSLPIFLHRSFDNPVFGRELRGKTRWRAASPLMWLMRVLLILAPLGFSYSWLNEIMAAPDGYQMHYIRSQALRNVSLLHMVLLCLYAAASGATMFTREHESNTWENLKLSLLTPSQILHGKTWPLFMALGVLSLPLCFVLLVVANTQASSASINTYYDYDPAVNFTFLHALAATLAVFASSCVCGSVSLFISWLSHTTQVALGLSVAVNAVLLLVFTAIANTSRRDPEFLHYLSWWNASAAINVFMPDSRFGYGGFYGFSTLHFLALLCPLFLAGVTAGFIAVVSGLMRQKFRDEK